MPGARVKYRELKRQAKSAQIIFNERKYNRLDSANVHSDHKDLFAIVQSLGRRTFENYGICLSIEISDKPWQLDNKKRALKLVHLAAKCRRESRNEAGWRNEVESKLFERFDIEVACKRCRRRLWTSEVEASPALSNSKTSSLVDRQRKREICKCNPSGRLGDSMDPGMSDLFSSRLQETVCQSGANDAQNPRKEPDRIHGLQRTTNFDRLLREPYGHNTASQASQRHVEDIVRSTVNLDNGGDPLLFPFLVLEAKSEKGGENFDQMEIQTAFPIRNALKLQHDLLKTPGNTMDVPGGPLVWYFASRGEDWRVYAASVYEEEGRTKYLVNYLWGGSVTGRDEALQLILIIDNILDWARDIYRPNILRQLKMLGAMHISDTATITVDPDVYSMNGEVQDWMEGQDLTVDEILDPNVSDTTSVMEESPLDCLGRFNTPRGVVRDARTIDSRLRALYITRDNIQMFLRGFENPNIAMRSSRSILAALSRRCVVLENEDALDEVEDRWSGNTRLRDRDRNPFTKVYAQFRISYYIDHAWNQIRELTYLAVSEDARELLIEAALFRRAVKGSKFHPPECTSTDLLRTFDNYLQRDVQQDFIAALSRHTFSLDMEDTPTGASHVLEDGTPIDESEWPIVMRQDKDKKSPAVAMQNIVDLIYAKYRIGQREPSEPFLRVSSRKDFEGRRLVPRTREGRIGRALVYGDVQNAPYLPQGPDQKLCLYILDGQIDEMVPFSVVAKLLGHLHGSRVYGTLRKGRVYKTTRKWEDNRQCYEFKLDKVEEDLKVSPEALVDNVYNWIKLLTPIDPISVGKVIASANGEIAQANATLS